MLMCVESLG